jgi:hypothetical protein
MSCLVLSRIIRERRKSLLLKETLREREGYSSRTLRERQRTGGFLPAALALAEPLCLVPKPLP